MLQRSANVGNNKQPANRRQTECLCRSVGRSVGLTWRFLYSTPLPVVETPHAAASLTKNQPRIREKRSKNPQKKADEQSRKAFVWYRLRVKIHCSVRYHRCTGFAHSFSSHHHNATMRGLPSKSQLTSTPKLTSQRTQAHREPKLTLTLTLTLTHKMRVSECVSE